LLFSHDSGCSGNSDPLDIHPFEAMKPTTVLIERKTAIVMIQEETCNNHLFHELRVVFKEKAE
jgi:hypothetical protein